MSSSTASPTTPGAAPVAEGPVLLWPTLFGRREAPMPSTGRLCRPLSSCVSCPCSCLLGAVASTNAPCCRARRPPSPKRPSSRRGPHYHRRSALWRISPQDHPFGRVSLRERCADLRSGVPVQESALALLSALRIGSGVQSAQLERSVHGLESPITVIASHTLGSLAGLARPRPRYRSLRCAPGKARLMRRGRR